MLMGNLTAKDLTSSKNGELDTITTEIFNSLESSL